MGVPIPGCFKTGGLQNLRSFALFCRLAFALCCRLVFALFCARLRSFACFCFRPRLEHLLAGVRGSNFAFACSVSLSLSNLGALKKGEAQTKKSLSVLFGTVCNHGAGLEFSWLRGMVEIFFTKPGFWDNFVGLGRVHSIFFSPDPGNLLNLLFRDWPWSDEFWFFLSGRGDFPGVHLIFTRTSNTRPFKIENVYLHLFKMPLDW